MPEITKPAIIYILDYEYMLVNAVNNLLKFTLDKY